MQVDELKATVKELHDHGIEVVLDVVFNHTAEGNEKGPTTPFRGLDNQTYHMLTPTVLLQLQRHQQHAQLHNPIVRGLVLDCSLLGERISH